MTRSVTCTDCLVVERRGRRREAVAAEGRSTHNRYPSIAHCPRSPRPAVGRHRSGRTRVLRVRGVDDARRTPRASSPIPRRPGVAAAPPARLAVCCVRMPTTTHRVVSGACHDRPRLIALCSDGARGRVAAFHRVASSSASTRGRCPFSRAAAAFSPAARPPPPTLALAGRLRLQIAVETGRLELPGGLPARHIRPPLTGPNAIGEAHSARPRRSLGARSDTVGLLLDIASRVRAGPLDVTGGAPHEEHRRRLACTDANVCTAVPTHDASLAVDVVWVALRTTAGAWALDSLLAVPLSRGTRV
jgi:hypothetical protein